MQFKELRAKYRIFRLEHLRVREENTQFRNELESLQDEANKLRSRVNLHEEGYRVLSRENAALKSLNKSLEEAE